METVTWWAALVGWQLDLGVDRQIHGAAVVAWHWSTLAHTTRLMDANTIVGWAKANHAEYGGQFRDIREPERRAHHDKMSCGPPCYGPRFTSFALLRETDSMRPF